MTIDAGVIGRRVVVRHRIDGIGPSGGPAMTDVVGRVLAVGTGAVDIERRDGQLATIALATIVTWKVVPDRPVRSRAAAAISAAALTQLTSRGWPAIESAPLGDWELRASRGFTGRANSVAVHGDPGMALEDALARVAGFYTGRGLPPRAQVVQGSSEDAAFAAAGWGPQTDYYGGAIVQVADLGSSYDPDPDVAIISTASDAWLAGYGRAEDPATARAVLEAPPTVGFASIDAPAAIGRVVVTGEWAGLSCVEVALDARRSGLARRVVETLLAWAAEHGADKAYLQTVPSNSAALTLYAPYGFVDHHTYRYLEPPR